MESFDTLRRQLLARVAELGDRYGLHLGDYVVEIRPEPGPRGTFGLERGPGGPMSLAFTVGPSDPTKAVRFRSLVESLTGSTDTSLIFGDFPALRDALDSALRVVTPL